MNPDELPFGETVYAYTRKQALDDGFQVDVSATAREAGIRFPAFLTRTVYDAFVAVPPKLEGQDDAGRLGDVVWMTRRAIGRSRPGADRITVSLYVRNDHRRPEFVKLVATCGPLDIDDPNRAITVMMPGED